MGGATCASRRRRQPERARCSSSGTMTAVGAYSRPLPTGGSRPQSTLSCRQRSQARRAESRRSRFNQHPTRCGLRCSGLFIKERLMPVAAPIYRPLSNSARRPAFKHRLALKAACEFTGGTRRKYSLPLRHRAPYNVFAGRLLRVEGPQNPLTLPVRTPPCAPGLRFGALLSPFSQ